MRSKVVRSLAVALLLCNAGMVSAQKPGGGKSSKTEGGGFASGTAPKQKTPPEKSKLEEMLAEALKNNPDIRVAVAKLAEADAELNRTRVQVMQKIVTLHAAIASKKTEVALREKQYKRYANLAAERAINGTLADEAEERLTLAKAQLEELEVQLPGLLGKVQKSSDAQAATAKEGGVYSLRISDVPDVVRYTVAERIFVAQPRIKGDISQAEKMRKALQTPVVAEYENMSFDAILKDLAKIVPGLSFRNLFEPSDSAKTHSLKIKDHVPVSAVLQALADETACEFYVRDYGILATGEGKAPNRAITVEEFLRQEPNSDEYKEANHFINGVWHALDSSHLEEKIPAAKRAFKTCKDVGDSGSIRNLYWATIIHADRLSKELGKLHPDVVIEDEKKVQQLKKVRDKLNALGADIADYLKTHPKK